MRRLPFVIAVLFTTFVTTFVTYAQAIDTAAVDRLVAGTIADWHAPGMAVAIVVDDKVVLVKGYGFADLASRKAVTDETLFEIASTTKAFTTTAMAMLVDEKKLDWDDPVRKHLPW